MTNRKLLNALIVLPLLCFVSCNNAGKKPTSDYPNIILIISDDQSWTDYSFMGHKYIQTPNIDRLAKEGLSFTRGYTTAPLCRPALASMITGLYPHQHGVLGNDPVFPWSGGQKWGSDWLKERKIFNEEYISHLEGGPCIPQLLEEAGYISLQTGKWWEGHYSRGGFSSGMTHGDPERMGRHGDDGLTIGREGLEILYEFIEDAGESGDPFFIWYAPFMPHAPHTPPDSLLKKYIPVAPTEAVAAYWAMCEWFDKSCGELISHIDKQGLGDNSLFIYVTDNGWIQDHDRPNRFAPRSKRSPYDMGIRTPILLRWPEKIIPEKDTVSLVSSVDIATTILALCGLSPTALMQGINVLDKEALSSRDVIFAENHKHDFSSTDSSLLHRIIIDRNWKLILPDPLNLPEAGPELYDLKKDPFEWRNLSEDNPEKVEELSWKLEEWWRCP